MMVTRVWWLWDPHDDRFASAVRIGTWEKIDGEEVRVPPLVLEWQRGSDVVPDFLWPSFEGDMAAQEHVFVELQERFRGIEAGPVEIILPKWKRKKRKSSEEGLVTIWSEDLHLVEVRIKHRVDIDWDRSRVKTVNQNGTILYEVHGSEGKEVIVDLDIPAFGTRRVARVKGGGIFVKASVLQGHSFFKVNQFPVWNLCTDEVRDFILEKQYTNIDFFEVGELF